MREAPGAFRHALRPLLPAPLPHAPASALPAAGAHAAHRLARLRAAAAALLPRAVAPYSGRAEAVVAVLASGALVPGVRLESASFPLTIGALHNALTSAAALAPGDAPVLVVGAAPLGPAERLLAAAFGLSVALADDALAAPGVGAGDDETSTGEVVFLAPGLAATARPADARAGVALARAVSARAVVPESNFHVGCVADAGGVLVPGCNVETAEWGQILCAERNAIGTIASYGLAAPTEIWLACPGDGCSPCGACRQLLAERAPGATVWMHGAGDAVVASTPEALLPGAFTGASLVR